LRLERLLEENLSLLLIARIALSVGRIEWLVTDMLGGEFDHFVMFFGMFHHTVPAFQAVQLPSTSTSVAAVVTG
jgi:hypothetical protein